MTGCLATLNGVLGKREGFGKALMRIIVMGQQAFGKAALEKLLADGRDEVVAVYCAPDRGGRPPDPLKTAAVEAELPVMQPKSLSNSTVIEELRAFGADLMIMAYVIQYVPQAACQAPAIGTTCFHPSLLPLHRGPSSINWPIIEGATRTGFSWFHPSEGLDEGDILLQWECRIGPDDTLGDVYFKKIFPQAIASLTEVCDLFRSGSPPRTPQDESKATYESWCRSSDAEINWSSDVDKVYNLIRGTNPQPGAWTTVDGAKLQIYDARKCAGDGTPGAVVEIDDAGVAVQARGGRILVKRVRPQGGGKIPAVKYAEDVRLKPGTTLGTA